MLFGTLNWSACEVQEDDVGLVVAHVHGRVIADSGDPVPSAQILVRARVETCENRRFVQYDLPVLSSAEGRFGGDVLLPVTEPFTACLRVIVTPPSGSSVGPGEAVGDTVFFYRGGGPMQDTAEVEVVLTSAGAN